MATHMDALVIERCVLRKHEQPGVAGSQREARG
jgi:hypothetical protein